MSDKFDKILNGCLDRMNRGQKIEDCLADYPEHAAELQPMLESMLFTKGGFAWIPTDSAKQRAKQRMMIALRQSESKQAKPRFAFPNILRNVKALATATAVIVIALASYFGVTLTTAPQIVHAIANADGNFALLMSDAPNAIGDFTSLTTIVSKIRLKSADDSRKWIEIDTEDMEVDLVLLQDDNALAIWRGDVPEGDYSEAVLYSDSVNGVLESSGETVSIKLPSGKLSLKLDFAVGGDEVTEFVYDITVISTGADKYILRPVVNESGTGKEINRVGDQCQGQGQN